MTVKNKFLLMAVFSLISTGSFAQDDGFTLGAKIGKLDIDGFSSGDNVGLNFGFGFGNGWSVELEMTQGDTKFLGATIDVDTKAIYGTYRSEGQGYFMGKIGFLDEEVSAVGISVSDSGLSYGFGGGYRFNDTVSAELEYTIIEADVNMIGLTARFSF